MQRHHYSRRWRVNNTTPESVLTDRIRCAVCGFAGVDINDSPAARLGAQPVTVNGSTYVWTAADDAISGLDKETMVVDRRGVCPFCHSERYLDGAKGSGLRVP